MKDKTFLMIPGPTPVPESALIEMAKHPMAHRSEEFSNILKEVYEYLKYVFRTKNDVYVFTASGTGAMCAALENLINEGDKVLCLSIGNFGARWAKIANSRGAVVTNLEVLSGNIITAEMLEEALKKDKYKIVTLTHSETSTGAANDVKTLCSIIKKYGALSVVDGITSLCSMEFKTDEWGIDVAISGSQKGFMIAPGLSFLTASEDAFKVHKQCKYPSFYFNWSEHKKSIAKNTTPFTPAVSLITSLHKVLTMIKEEGIENINARHKRHALSLRSAIRTIGLKLFVENDNNASYAITSVLPPDGISVADIRKTLKNDYDIIIANGQGNLENKIFRIGTLGFVCDRDIIMAIGSLEASLMKLDYKFEIGNGVKKLIEELKK